jgi:hypothetical protein
MLFAPGLELTRVPAVNVGMLIRRPPGDVYRAFADPAIEAWFCERNEGDPTTVELRFFPRGGSTFVRVTETGFSGDGDEIVARVAESTAGFTKVLCAVKALLEHGVVLTVVPDHGQARGPQAATGRVSGGLSMSDVWPAATARRPRTST